MKVALVCDWLTNMGGAERVIINFTEIYKDSTMYTTIYNKEKLDKSLQNINAETSFLQKFKKAKTKHQAFFPLMPIAVE